MIEQNYHDWARSTREDADFRNKLLEATKKLATGKQAGELLMHIFRMCGYNLGYLLPYFFPHFEGPAKPMTLTKRAFAFPMYAMLLGGFLIIRGSRQISKSTNISARMLMLNHIMPRWKSYYIAPHREHTRTFALKCEEMSRFCRFPMGGKGRRDNMYRKESPNLGGFIEICNVLTSASHMRGKTGDELCFDEYQLFDARLEAEISQLQRTSERPVTIYAGTSTTLDSPLEIRFSESSGGVWHMRSRSNEPGKRYINMSDPELFLKMLQPKCLSCPHTGLPIIDPLDGFWEHERPEEYIENNRLGLHVPQVLVPEFTRGDEWNKIFKYYKNFGDARTLQEVGGIAVENGLKELSKADLQNMCVLPFKDGDAIQKWARESPRYVRIISGCDWGGSDYQMARNAKTSYTVHVVIGVRGDGTFDILHMQRHSGMAYHDIGRQIVTRHLFCNGSMMASDYGAGIQYNTLLHNHPDIRPGSHWIFEYGPPKMAMLRKPPFGFSPTHLMLNKTESVTMLFNMIKSGRLRCFAWDAAEELLSDLLNCQRVHSEAVQSGRQYFLMISNPSRPSDTLHALNFACTLARMSMQEPLIDDPALRDFVFGTIGQVTQAKYSPLAAMGFAG